jgi:hypothetical protein
MITLACILKSPTASVNEQQIARGHFKAKFPDSILAFFFFLLQSRPSSKGLAFIYRYINHCLSLS